jgi:hypothetical protein
MERFARLQLGPNGGCRRGLANSGELAAGPCRGRAGGGLGVPYGSIQWAGRGGRAAGERRAGGQGGAAAAVCVRRRGKAAVGNARRGKFPRVPRGVHASLDGAG